MIVFAFAIAEDQLSKQARLWAVKYLRQTYLTVTNTLIWHSLINQLYNQGEIPDELLDLFNFEMQNLNLRNNRLSGELDLDLRDYSHFDGFSDEQIENYMEQWILDGNELELVTSED